MLILSSQVLKSLLKISIYIKCKKLNFLLRLFKYLKIKIALHFSMVTHIFIQFNFQIFCTISERTRAQEDPIEVEQINFAHPVQCLTQVVYEQNSSRKEFVYQLHFPITVSTTMVRNLILDFSR